MFDSYDAVFNRRGAAYHAAMAMRPECRDAEFAALFARIRLEPGMVLVDIPAGGGYLRRKLPDGVTHVALEVSQAFCDAPGSDSRLCSWDRWDLGDASADVVVCCAALHHVDEPTRAAFFDEVARVLKPGGTAVCADVEVDTPPASFLNGFVDAHNPDGHDGRFIDAAFAGVHAAASRGRLRVIRNEVCHYPWRLGPDRDGVLTFTRLMFGMPQVADAELGGYLESEMQLGLCDGEWRLPWQLRFVAFERTGCGRRAATAGGGRPRRVQPGRH
jgi:SAM-dependent methyltransferase